MKRIYKACATTTTMFIADESDDLHRLAGEFCEEENNNLLPSVTYEEVRSLDDLPQGWSGSELLWGADEEITAKDWFKVLARIQELESEIERLRKEMKS